MATMTDYKVVSDTSFVLEANEEKTFTLKLESNVFRSKGRARPILAYVADPNHADNLRFEIWINNVKIKESSFNGGVRRGLWEGFIFPESNDITIHFRVESGSGSVRFQDVVLWYQRTI